MTDQSDITQIPAPELVFDMRKDGWELVHDLGWQDIDLSSKWKLYNPGNVTSCGIVRIAWENVNFTFGQLHAEYFLRHQRHVPNFFRIYEILFCGTIWRDDNKKLCVPYNIYNGAKGVKSWEMHFLRFETEQVEDPRLLYCDGFIRPLPISVSKPPRR